MENSDDIRKYFDSKEYNTAIIGKEGGGGPAAQDEGKISTLITLLTDPASKDVKEQALLTLKKEKKGAELLLMAIASPKSDGHRHTLVAACWESEINFSKYLPFFILLALQDDYLVSLEAITVIEHMEGPFEEAHLSNAIGKVKEKQKGLDSERAVLLNDLLHSLQHLSQHGKE